MRLQHLSRTRANLAHESREKSLRRWNKEFGRLDSNERFAQAEQLYLMGAKIGAALFDFADAEGSPTFMASAEELMPLGTEVRTLDLPELGSFKIGVKQADDTGQEDYFLTNNPQSDREIEGDYLAFIKSTTPGLVRGFGGLAMLVYLKEGVVNLDVLRREAGLPKVRALELIRQ